jgi:predicted RNA-binding protein (virulence factor B family)
VIEVGKINNLIINRETKSGYYLIDDASGEEVFMPPAMAPLKMEINQDIKAFVYLDTNGDLIATDQTPYAEVGEYALMKVIDVQDFGAFFDWGIEKDLLVPGNEQKVNVRPHEDHLVRVCIEEETGRVFGTTKVGRYIEESDFDIEENDKVQMVPFHRSELGFSVIINKKFIGMIYANEVFTYVQIGTPYEGVVKKIRNDGLVDCALQVQGIQNVVDAKSTILEMLEENRGKSKLHDKSSPEDIKGRLGMSKKTFKNAIGMLYKERKILISKNGIELVSEVEK